MLPLRALFLRHRAIALLLVLAALCMKALVPGGYMIGQSSKVLTVQICHDGLGEPITRQIVIPMNGEPGDHGSKQGKSDCAFSSLSMASLAGAGPALLAIALAFIIALGFAPVRLPHPQRIFHLRPPLRGPPAFA
ncbi:DUF2946 family protein [Sphingobium lignivorans]|uniref:DUF2946 domain-containing protein n=1 Tax=Sphingobium lignivorans TaxID=2735886 RepID=A0ABR6NER1_9SPHN|nr:DUF2946 family protein [Sphingobium lignivorans]MBB5985760.1 hypothetical protein [Sphingobium lignivorans]